MKVKEFLGGLSSWAGTSKDEIVAMVCKEIGQATANTLKEPLDQIMSSKKLKITVELVARENQHRSPLKEEVFNDYILHRSNELWRKRYCKKDGKILFISGAIVGDEVEIEITKNKKRFAEAKVTKLISSSKENPEPLLFLKNVVAANGSEHPIR